jgi:hypothetical protein
MSDTTYETTERVLALLLLLVTGPYERKEIFAKIPLYGEDDGSRAKDRMFERDLACLKGCGFLIETQRGGRAPACYRLDRAEVIKRF